MATLDAQALLQLFVTFGIAGQYSVEAVCRYVTLIARRKQSAVLCRALGLEDKMPELVDRLAKDGKQVEALRFAHEFGIMDRVQPVPMLKGYLKEAKKAATTILKNGNSSAAAQNESTVKEMGALRTVIRCIEEYEIESQFPSAPLKKRMEQLDKAKADRKRAAVTLKAQTKRPRANDGNFSSQTERDRGFPRGDSARYGAGVIGSRPPYTSSASTNGASYQGNLLYGTSQVATTYTGGTTYDRRASGGLRHFNSSGGSPVALTGSFLYASDSLSPAPTVLYASPNQYSTPPSSYTSAPTSGAFATSGYQFGSGLPPPPPAYQTSYKH